MQGVQGAQAGTGAAQTINALGKKARDGTLSIDEMAGGTFTISNGGVYGSLLSTPIINPPQSAILGMHSINPRAAVRGLLVAHTVAPQLHTPMRVRTEGPAL